MGDFFMKKDFQVSGVYIAAIIGAGFASGSEVVYYFAKFGKIGFFGIVLSSLLFGLMAGWILGISKEKGYNDFNGFLDGMFPQRVVKVLKGVIYLFMFVVFSAMISGSGETVSILTGGKKMWGVIAILVTVAVVLLKDIRGFMSVSGILSVFMIIGILGVSIYLLRFREIEVFSPNVDWVGSGISYTGYNILTAAAILPAMSGCTEKPGRVGVISGVGLGVMILSLWGIISIYYGKIPLGSIPMLTICKRQGVWLSVIYSMVLYMAMFTTALANGFALLDVMNMKRVKAIGVITVLGFFTSSFSFDFFVDVVYRMAGVLGIAFMGYIFLKKVNLLEKWRKIKKKRA